MNIVHQLPDIAFEKNSVVTVGTFDGIHLAHREVIREAVVRAKGRGGRSVVVTFDPHPKEVLSKDRIEMLTTTEEKQHLCEGLGVDLFYIIQFTFEFSRQSFRQFYLDYLINGVGVSEVIEGYDHHFGRDREGSVEDLLRLGREFEFSVVAMKPVYVGEEIVGSTSIRKYLHEGNVERALLLLGRPYSLSGKVVRGDGRGKQLGYPTANIRLHSAKKLIPRNGIYFVEVVVNEEPRFGMASIGVRPTFVTNGARTVEVNILDFESEIYGERLEVRFFKRLRDELAFDSAQQLVQQMHKDKDESLRLVEHFSTHQVTKRA